MNKNTLKKAQIVQNLVKMNYQPGRQDRCKLWVLRHIISEKLPISQSTFFRYLNISKKEQEKKLAERQISIQFDEYSQT